MGRGRMASGRGSRSGTRSSRGRVRHGGVRFGYPGTTIFVDGDYYNRGFSWIGIVVGAIFVLVGIWIVFGAFGKIADSFKYDHVQAKCISNKQVGFDYCATYEYTIDGKNYTNMSEQCWENPAIEEKEYRIYYLKSNPNKIYEDKPADLLEGVVLIFAGVICAGMGTIPIVIIIRQYKANKNEIEGTSTKSEKPLEPEDKICEYCGTKYNRKLHSCPKCGAGRVR